MKSSEKVYDDLTKISGIGPARQRWLRESFNTRTYQDLADLSIIQIESKLKADGQIASRDVIKGWLIQAQEFAANVNRLTTPDLEPAGEKHTNEPKSLAREDGWKPFASFVVEFQTRKVDNQAREHRTAAHYMEQDTDTYWPGVESKKLCSWMVDQIGDQVDLEMEGHDENQEPSAKALPAAKSSIKTQINQVRVFQPPKSKIPTHSIEAGKPFRGSVKSDKPFTLEVDFELIGPVADVAGEQIEFNALSYAYNQAKGASIHLGNTGPNILEEGKINFTFTSPKATLQQGMYRLLVIVTTQQTALAAPDYIEIPFFQVA